MGVMTATTSVVAQASDGMCFTSVMLIIPSRRPESTTGSARCPWRSVLPKTNSCTESVGAATGGAASMSAVTGTTLRSARVRCS